jgi:hypothetical protein
MSLIKLTIYLKLDVTIISKLFNLRIFFLVVLEFEVRAKPLAQPWVTVLNWKKRNTWMVILVDQNIIHLNKDRGIHFY